MADEKIYETIVIGGGAAGLTAALYTSREGMDMLLLEKGNCGGLAASTELIENYPGFSEGINGNKLLDEFKRQAERFDAKIKEFEQVQGIEKNGELIEVKTDKEKYKAHTLIIASGSIPKPLNVPGEREFFGRGVSYCAACDGPLFKDKDIAIVGCGNSGLQEGEFLLKHVKHITFVEFLPQMSASKVLQDRLRKSENTKFLLNHELVSINGEERVEFITLKDKQSDEKKEIKVSGVFIYAGFLPNTDFLKGSLEMDSLGYIKTDYNMQTSISGVFAAGDVRSKKVRQIDVACGEATISAIAARDYLMSKRTEKNS